MAPHGSPATAPTNVISANDGAAGTSMVASPSAAKLAVIRKVAWPARSISMPPSGIVTMTAQETRLVTKPALCGDSPCDVSSAGAKLTTRM